jgi:hypothetical protein
MDAVTLKVDDVALLTRWAMSNGLNETRAPEHVEDIPMPEPNRHKQRIRRASAFTRGSHRAFNGLRTAVTIGS